MNHTCCLACRTGGALPASDMDGGSFDCDCRTDCDACTADYATAMHRRECMRCGEVGNVEHDNDIAMCNLCTDAIQCGHDPHRYNPAERCTVCGHPHEDEGAMCGECAARIESADDVD